MVGTKSKLQQVRLPKKTTNVRAVALSLNPSLVTATPAEKKGQPPKLVVNEPLLSEVIENNLPALEQEVERRRRPAIQPLLYSGVFPVSNRDWCRLMRKPG